LDVKNIFFQGTLEEEIYIVLPVDYIQEDNSNLVCRLNKLIYGLKQSARVWYEKLSSYLIFYIFLTSNVNHSLFCKINENFTIMVLVHADDIIITDNNVEEIGKIKMQLR
jgi:Reverse transcriptase (RNA-dependent DNA polymerase)